MNNRGQSENDPLPSILNTFQRLKYDELKPITIHLLNGKYSNSETGECFPIILIDNMELSGASADCIIIDAENINSVISVNGMKNVTINNLTSTGGKGDPGGGITCFNSDLFISNVIIKENDVWTYWDTDWEQAGGIICDWFSNLTLTNSLIVNNKHNALHFYSSNAVLSNVTIYNNEKGICFYDSLDTDAELFVINSILWGNQSPQIEHWEDYLGIFTFFIQMFKEIGMVQEF